MVLTLNGDVLTHKNKNGVVEFINKASVKNYSINDKKDINVTIYHQNNSGSIIIYSYNDFDKIIRVNMETTSSYTCVPF